MSTQQQPAPNDAQTKVYGPVDIDQALFDGLRDAIVASVILWAPKSPGVAHWRTSYTFQTPVSEFIGMSLDMFQPGNHQHHDPVTEASKNPFGCLLVKATKTKLTTRSPAVQEEYQFRQTVTVATLLESIYNGGLQNYKFHPEGSGCMFWQLSLLDRMANRWHWINQGDVAGARDVIQTARSQSKAVEKSMPWPPVQGQFY